MVADVYIYILERRGRCGKRRGKLRFLAFIGGLTGTEIRIEERKVYIFLYRVGWVIDEA